MNGFINLVENLLRMLKWSRFKLSVLFSKEEPKPKQERQWGYESEFRPESGKSVRNRTRTWTSFRYRNKSGTGDVSGSGETVQVLQQSQPQQGDGPATMWHSTDWDHIMVRQRHLVVVVRKLNLKMVHGRNRRWKLKVAVGFASSNREPASGSYSSTRLNCSAV